MQKQTEYVKTKLICKIGEISRICKEHNIPHVVNNAYGLQCPVIAKMINKSSVVGRLDAGQQLLHNILLWYYLTLLLY